MAWEWLIRSTFDALSDTSAGRLLAFDSAAEQDFTLWQKMTERQRRPDGELAQIVQWSTKLNGQFIRLAALMALATDAGATKVDRDERCRYTDRRLADPPTWLNALLPAARHDAVGVVHTVDRLDRADDGLEVAGVGQLEVEAHLRDAVGPGVGGARHDVDVMVRQGVRHIAE
jgi:hypothetical protein